MTDRDTDRNTLIVEPSNEPGDLDTLEKELGEAVTAGNSDEGSNKNDDAGANNTGQSADSGDGGSNEERIPEKYRGKSVEEIIEMHRNAERKIGEMANDLGQQRQFTDRVLGLAEQKRSNDLDQNGGDGSDDSHKPEISAAEILENPTAALDKYYETRREREARELNERLDGMETSLAQRDFVAKHPDYQDIGNDPAFVEWLQSSPLRQRAAQAALNGDWQTADDLMTEFKQVRQQQQSASNENANEPRNDNNQSDDVEAARRAALESSSNQEVSSQSSGKVYRRADLIRLKLEKPHVWESEDFQREILRAYSEGRVK